MRLVWNSFLSPPSSDRAKEPFQPLFFCFNRRAYGTAVIIFPFPFSNGVALKILLQFHLDRLGVPNFIAVLPNRTVRGKFAHSGCIENRHPRPVVSVLISLAD